MRRFVSMLTFMLLILPPVLAQVLSSSSDASNKLQALFDEDWQWSLEQYPENATSIGDNRFNDRLTDLSPEAIELRKGHERAMLDRIQKIDRSRLKGQDAISYDLFMLNKKLNVEGERFPGELMPIDQMNGVQISFGQLVSNTPFRNAKDYDDYLARLAAFYPKCRECPHRGLRAPAVHVRAARGVSETNRPIDRSDEARHRDEVGSAGGSAQVARVSDRRSDRRRSGAKPALPTVR